MYGSMKDEMRERSMQEKEVVGSLGRMMKEWTVSMEVREGLCDGIIVLTITYVRETWVWYEKQKSRIQVVEISYLETSPYIAHKKHMLKLERI